MGLPEVRTPLLHTHRRGTNAVTFTQRGRQTNLLLTAYNSLLLAKLLTRHLNSVARQINKYTPFVQRPSFLSLSLLTEQYFGERCHDKKLPGETYAVREVMGRGQRGNRMPGIHWRAGHYEMRQLRLGFSCSRFFSSG